MTDPEMADRTYIEPLTPEVVTRVIETERPDASVTDHGRSDRLEPGGDSWRKTAPWTAMASN